MGKRNTGKPGGVWHGQHPDHHITSAAKNDYYERFPKRTEGFNDAAAYRRIATEIDQGDWLPIDDFVREYLQRSTPGTRHPQFRCEVDPREQASASGDPPVFVMNEDCSKVISIWTTATFAEEHETARIRAANARQVMAAESASRADPEPDAENEAEPSPTRDNADPEPDTGSMTEENTNAAPESSPMTETAPAPGETARVTVQLVVEPDVLTGLMTGLIAKGRARIAQGGVEVEFVARRDQEDE